MLYDGVGRVVSKLDYHQLEVFGFGSTAENSISFNLLMPISLATANSEIFFQVKRIKLFCLGLKNMVSFQS